MADRRLIRPGEYGAVFHRRVVPAIIERRIIEPPDSVKLATGEYVSKSEFDKLTSAEQSYLKEMGVAAYNVEQERVHGQQVRAYEEAVAYVEREEAQQEEWVKENIIEVGPEKERILRATFEGLSSEEQTLLEEIGVEEFNRPLSGRALFDRLKSMGRIPVDATFVSESEGEVKYELPTAAPATAPELQETFTTLKDYRVGITYPWEGQRMPEMGYDLARYLKDYPENSAILIAAGFKPDDVTGAKLASQSYGAPVVDISVEEKIELLEPLQFRDEATGKTINIHKLIEREGEGVIDKVWGEINPEWKANLVTAQAQFVRQRDWEIGIIPIVGTVYLWDKMPTWAKSVSIVGDVLFFACLVGVNPIKWVAPKLFERVPKAAAIYERVVAQNVDEAVKMLGGVDPRLLKPFQGAVNAATKYADDFTRLRAVQFTIDQCDDILRSGRLTSGSVQHQAVVDLLAQSTDDLARATKTAATSRATLLRLAGEYTDDATRSLLPVGALSPGERTLLESLKEIPRRLVGSIENVAVPPVVDVATIRAQLLTSKSALLAAKTKFPLEPTMWIDLVDDVARLEGKLLNAKIGSVQALYNQLLAARQTLPELEKVLKTLGKGTLQYDEMAREITRLKGLIKTLPKQVDDAIRAMEVVAVPGGSEYWGGSVAVMSPTDTAKLATLTTPVTTFELTKTGLLPLTTAIAAKVVVPITLKPEVAPLITPITPSITRVQFAGIEPLTSKQMKSVAKVTGLTRPQVRAIAGAGTLAEVLSAPEEAVSTISAIATQAATEAFTEAIAEGATTTEAEAAAQVAALAAAQASTQQAIQSATANIVDAAAQAAAQTAAKNAVKAATQTLVRTAVQTAVTPVTIPITITPPKIPKAKAIKKRKVVPDGSPFFKMGFTWHLFPYRKGPRVPISTREPPKDAKVLDGTPTQTLGYVGNIRPKRNIPFDLGFIDGYIDVKRSVVRFKSDWRLETDVGKREPSTTRGYSPEEAEALGVKPPRPRRKRVTTPRRRAEPKVGVVRLGRIDIGL